LLNNLLLFLIIFLLPTQLGRHFFFPFSYLSGVRSDYLAPTLYVTDLLVIAAAALNYKVASAWFVALKQKYRWELISFAFFVFINMAAAAIISITVYRWLKVIEWAVLFLIIAVNRRRAYRLIFKGFFFGAIAQFIIVLFQLIHQHSLGGVLYWLGERPLSLSMPGIAKASLQGVELLRPYGTFSHPNSLAGFYLLIYAWTITQKPPSQSPLLRSALLLISTFLVFFSFSKVAIVAYLIINFSVWLLSKKPIDCRLCVVAKILIPSLLALVFLLAKTDPLSLQKRLTLIKNSWEIFLKHPVFGVGLGNYLTAQNLFPNHFADYFQQPVHNIFLLGLCEIGLAGLIFMTIIVKTIWPLIRRLQGKSNLLILLTIIITGFFDHYWLTLQQNWLLLAIVLADILSISVVTDKRKPVFVIPDLIRNLYNNTN